MGQSASATTAQGRNCAASPQHQFGKRKIGLFAKRSQEVDLYAGKLHPRVTSTLITGVADSAPAVPAEISTVPSVDAKTETDESVPQRWGSRNLCRGQGMRASYQTSPINPLFSGRLCCLKAQKITISVAADPQLLRNLCEPRPIRFRNRRLGTSTGFPKDARKLPMKVDGRC
jgi:hypothetical protein